RPCDTSNNDEYRKSNDERMMNDEIQMTSGLLFVLHLCFVIHSTFEVRHSIFTAVHFVIGWRAARTSSGRLMSVLCGAWWSRSGDSSVMRNSVSANASSVSLLSVSVGSIIIASGTVSGK